jgi:hypothetical protein
MPSRYEKAGTCVQVRIEGINMLGSKSGSDGQNLQSDATDEGLSIRRSRCCAVGGRTMQVNDLQAVQLMEVGAFVAVVVVQ